jgi:hypothetical protein
VRAADGKGVDVKLLRFLANLAYLVGLLSGGVLALCLALYWLGRGAQNCFWMFPDDISITGEIANGYMVAVVLALGLFVLALIVAGLIEIWDRS